MFRLPLTVGRPDPLLEALRRRASWFSAGAGVGIGALLGLAWVLATPPSYTATAAVEVMIAAPQVNVADSGPRPQALSMDTDAQIALSDGVISAVADATGDDPLRVRQALTLAARPLTQILSLNYTAGSSDAARAGADAAAQSFLDERERLVVDPVRTYLTVASSEGLTRDAQRHVLRGRDPVLASLEQWRQAALLQLIALQEGGRVQEGARLTEQGYPGDPLMPVATGAGLGLIMSLALVGLVESRRMRRRSSTRPG